MTAVTRFLIGAAGVATLVGAAAPAAAQYGGYGRGVGDVIVGSVIDSVIGGGRYGGYGNSGYGGYGNSGYGGYDNYGGYGNSGYGNQQALIQRCARAAEQRASGRSASGYGNYGYGDSRYGDSRYGDNRYGYANSARVVGITSVERRRDRSLRIKGLIDAGGGYDQGRYGNSGYGGYGGYGSDRYGASSNADLRFQCNIDYRGRITNLDLNRNDRRYGY